MALSKKQETAVLLVYEAYWDHYLKGEVAAMPPLLDASYTQVGSAESEVFSKKKEAVQFLRDTIDEVAGKLAMRNRSTRLEQQGDLVLIHELCDLYARDGKKWIFYSKFRATTLLQEKKEGWKITHQHSSFPDSKTEAGQNVAIDKIAEENKELREAVKRRTVELEHKNRELEIEASLEKVRARGMSMHSSEELAELVATLLNELIKLDVGLRSCIIWIHDFDDQKDALWVASPEIHKPAEPFYIHPFHPAFFKSIVHAWKSDDPKWIYELSGKEKTSFQSAFFKEVPKLPQKLKSVLTDNKKVYFSASFNRFGAMEIISNEPLSEKSFGVLHRFGKVFNSTYTRFLDLQKAEAQAREAQIEASLERVRSRSMAMHTSEELIEVATLLHQEIKKIGYAQTLSSSFVIIDEENKTQKFWGAISDTGLLQQIDLPLLGDKILKDRYEAWKRKEPLFYQKVGGARLKKHLETTMPERFASKEVNQSKTAMPDPTYFYFANFSYGSISLLNSKPFTADEESLMPRYAKVFEQTYTRFLDLQKAEAQAREAHIQLALERVRARSMAMQSSDELSDVLSILFKQFDELGILPVNVWLSLFNIEENTFTYRATGTGGSRVQRQQVIDMGAMDIWKETLEHWKSGAPETVLVTLYPPDIFPQMMEIFKETFDAMPEEERISPDYFPNGLYNVQGYCKFGYIGFNHTRQPTKEEEDILRKFATEFERVYQRFLDIEKAEAQAREAQIEASLERIRASAMAMHQSNELSEVLTVLFDQFDILGVNPVFAHLSLIDLENNSFTYRMTGRGGKRVLTQQVIDLNARKEWKDIVEGFKTGKLDDVTCLHFPKEAVPQIWELFDETFSSLPKGAKVYPKDFPDGIFNTQGFCKFGYIGFNHNRPATEEEKDIVVRFATEFGRMYQRYLDIEKAEAQAREAQIQLGLERVRARAMAMHTSSELSEASVILYKELRSLGMTQFFNCGYVVVDVPNKTQYGWTSTFEGGEIEGYALPLMGDEVLDERYKHWKKQVPVFRQLVGGTKLLKHLEYVLPQLGSQEVREMAEANFPDPTIFYCCNFKYGYLSLITGEQLSADEESLLARFTQAFELTYGRFLDLQKAEAQAREAHIQLALERVRAKAMAMRRSEELTEVLPIIFEQLDGLGVKTVWTHLTLIDLEKNTFTYRMTGRAGKRVIAEQVVDMDASDIWKNAVETFKSEKPNSIVSFYFPPESLAGIWEIFDGIFSTLAEGYKIHPEDFPGGVYTTQANCEFGYIGINNTEKATDEEETILLRFAKEFGRLYRRFLDLQKAEAQARESQIQLSLERVRAKSMAMQSSEELHEVLSVLFQQFDNLGIHPVNVFLSLFDRETRTLTYRASGKSGTRIPGKQVVEVDNMEPLKALYDKWLNDNSDSVEVIYYPKEILPDLFGIFADTFTSMPKKDRMGPDDFPNGGYSMAGYTPFGYLGYDHQRLATAEEKDILSRFCIEFTRVYQRFLDLQKAEAQAREAKIEAALERVRSRTMAMHKSEELLDAGSLLYHELLKFGISNLTSGYCLMEADEKIGWNYIANQIDGTVLPKPMGIPHHETDVMRSIAQSWKKQDPFHIIQLNEAETILHQTFIAERTINFNMTAKELIARTPKRLALQTFNFKQGYLLIVGAEPLLKEQVDMLVRFAKVFEMTYQRFLDLQKAEAQAREAQIEAALERVRSKTMAMHNSKDVGGTVVTLFDEVIKLGLDKSIRCGIGILEGTEKMETWSAASSTKGEVDLKMGLLNMTIHPMLVGVRNAWERRETKYSYEFKGKDVTKYYTALNKEPDYPFQVDVSTLPDNVYHNSFFFTEGFLFAFTWSPLTEEATTVLRRFAGVFGQTYRRYLDLLKAEAQAREAQIEAALEKVRSQSLAMHSTSEMQKVANAVYEQLNALGLEMDAVGMSGVIEAKQDYDVWIGGSSFDKPLRIPFNDATQVQRDYNQAIESRSELFARTYSGEIKKEYTNHLLSHGSFPENLKKRMLKSDAFSTSISFAKNSSIQIARYTDHPYSDNENEILKRFAKVFEQAYIRFRDIEKAELQAREAQIEAALEKVRSRTMAMHKSEELGEVAAVMFEQISLLTHTPDRFNIGITNEVDTSFDIWVTDQKGHEINRVFVAKADKSPIIASVFNARKNKKTLVLDLYGKRLKEWVHYMNKEVGIPFNKGQVKDHRYINSVFFSHGFIGVTTNEPLEPETLELVGRFAKVFQQTYVRFLDLQKAEGQAREAQIEAALEKVRSRSLAMHSTDELQEVVTVVGEKLRELGVILDSGGAVICTYFPDSKDVMHWTATFDATHPSVPYYLPYFDTPIWKETWASKYESNDDFFEKVFSFEDKNHFFLHAFEHSDYKNLPEEYKKELLAVENHALSFAWQTNSALMIPSHNGKLLPEEHKSILKRFSRVFEQAYIRFMDLQKSEEQAREAQIEVALERVRSRAMAMHHSDELTEVLGVLFDQFDFLGINPVLTHLTLMDEENETFTLRITRGGKNRVIAEQRIDINAVESWKTSFANWKKSELHALDLIDYPPDILPFVWELMDEVMSALPEGQKIYPSDFPDGLYTTQGHCKYGYIGFNHTRRATEEEKEIVIRFAKEFGRLYQRFLDIQKAEVQAREAQIEAALERVRSRSMAMQHSSELNLILAKVFEELTSLELEMERAVIWTYNPQDRSVRWWAANPEAESGSESFFIANQDDPVYNEYWKAWEERRTKYLYILEGDYKENWTDILFNKTELGRLPDIVKAAMVKPERIYLYNTFNDFGVLFIACLEPLPEDKFTILERFGKVFDQSYTRFNDIKQAEARAQEAIKQSSLDRVRGQIASMRSTTDLDRITPLVWDELTTLGVPFIRCGVFIINEATQIVKAYLSSPKGESLGVLDLPFKASTLTSDSVVYWRKKKVLHRHWNSEEFMAWTTSLMEQGLLKNKRAYQGTSEPPESLDLHFIPFDQGMLYVGSEAALSPFQIDLTQALANAFSVAYARYEDFAELERAKESIETTLHELKATQNQLVQSEKMASLGELTAGIAHEIQNPLNFVNNFSEVSKELLEEMMEEMEKGEVEEVKSIAEDIIQNLEKIVHHGKRADGIVKGMLQHSRSSSGEKEPTDINILADEYLRLAYHGLRAKDKSFNASLETHFDDTLGKVMVIPQDIGRVILNLITNAFYVVKEKSSFANSSKEASAKLEASEENYEPTVTVTTRKEKDKVEISVRDNGNGIPKKVLDKIFQPFFTTKPTGEGTGLGLSMSYDIVTKGHNGRLEVKTKEGEGSEFTISLPLNQ